VLLAGTGAGNESDEYSGVDFSHSDLLPPSRPVSNTAIVQPRHPLVLTPLSTSETLANDHFWRRLPVRLALKS
jgi:hypothetical protein